MAEIAPESIRDAAEVVQALYPSSFGLLITHLRAIADKREHEQAEKAKREKRIEGLAEELWKLFNPGWSFDVDAPRFRKVARSLLDRCPALAEAVDE